MVVFMGIIATIAMWKAVLPNPKTNQKPNPNSRLRKSQQLSRSLRHWAQLSLLPKPLEDLNGLLILELVGIWCHMKLCRNRVITSLSFPVLPMTRMKSWTSRQVVVSRNLLILLDLRTKMEFCAMPIIFFSILVQYSDQLALMWSRIV